MLTSNFKEQYAELLSLTKNYLQKEYLLNERIFSETETYTYFKTYALQKKQPTQQPAPLTVPLKNEPSLAAAPRQVSAPPLKSAVVPEQQKPKNFKDTKSEMVAVAEKEVRSPAKNEEKESIHKEKDFVLDTPQAVIAADFSEMRKIFQEKLPHIHARLNNTLPDDSEAKVLSKLWTQEKQIPQVIILSFDEVPKHQTFLFNICKALEVNGIKAQVDNAQKLERDKNWQALLEAKETKLVLASSAGFYNLSELQKHYREGNKQGRYFLGDKSLLLLSDISFYLKEPTLKPSLWAAIKELLATTSKHS